MKVARAAGRLRSATDRASVPAPSTAHRHRAGRRSEHRRRTRSHDSGAGRRRSGYHRRRAPGRARSGRCDRSGGPTSRTACRTSHRGSGNGSHRARPEEARTARSLCCRAACRVCDRSGLGVPVRAVRPMAEAAPRQLRSPMPGRRGRQTMAAATRSPGPASRPARSPAHADGTAARPGRPGSAPRRSAGPCRKDQRAPCASYRHRIRTGRVMPPSYRKANSSCCSVKAGEVNGYAGGSNLYGAFSVKRFLIQVFTVSIPMFDQRDHPSVL
jgi:hypothetical protein